MFKTKLAVVIDFLPLLKSKFKVAPESKCINLVTISGPLTMWGHSRQMTLALRFVVILTMFGSDLPLFFSTRAVAEITQSGRKCTELCGLTQIPYPFYIKSRECGRGGFRLECQNNSDLNIEFNNLLYPVINILPDGIIIDPLRGFCSNNLDSFNLNGVQNYAIASMNFIQFSECKNTHTVDCDVNCNLPLRVINDQCKFNETCCFPLYNASFWPVGESNLSRFSQLQCTSFLSWVVTSQTIPFKTQYGLKLEWGIVSTCANVKCDVNARCEEARAIKGGVRCTCNDGYDGDGYVEGSGCVKACIRHGDQQYGKDCEENDWKGSKIIILSAAVVAAAAALLVAGLISAAMLVRWRAESSNHSGGVLRQRRRSDGSQLASLLPSAADDFTTELFSYKTLDRATKGFADSQTCGHGACGTVYAGRLPDGRQVAVKRMHCTGAAGSHGAHQLLNEISLLSTIKHQNLVRLLGCCLEAEDPILVYEYVPNGTLSEHLQRQRNGGAAIDWRCRCAVAADAAKALAHLHADLEPPVYHRDVKSCNILLDHDFNCKVADFGLSRLAPPDGGTHISTAPQGTPGYLDPEYHQNFHLSDKSDVYSFGVVLVEIITGMKPVDFSRDRKEVNLAALAVAKITAGRLDDIIDPGLEVGGLPRVRALVQRMAELAFRCLAYDKDARPPMTEVAAELDEIRKQTEEEEGGDFVPAADGESPERVDFSPTSVQALWPSNSTVDSLTYT